MKTGSQEDMIDQLRDQVDELAMWKSARLEEDANPLIVVAPDQSLTRREQFAMAAMQGMLSNGAGLTHGDLRISAQAVTYADALIDRLDEVEA